jgi:hypothetical protein
MEAKTPASSAPARAPYDLQLALERAPGLLHRLESRGVGGSVWVPEDGDSLDPGIDLLEELEALGLGIVADFRQPGDVPTRLGEACDMAQPDGIGMREKDDGE